MNERSRKRDKDSTELEKWTKLKRAGNRFGIPNSRGRPSKAKDKVESRKGPHPLQCPLQSALCTWTLAPFAHAKDMGRKVGSVKVKLKEKG